MSDIKMLNKIGALENAIELAKINIQSTAEWAKPEDVVKFIQAIFDALNGETD